MAWTAYPTATVGAVFPAAWWNTYIRDNGNVLGPVGLGPLPFCGPVVPTGWLKCDGSAVSRSTYATLFTVLSTRYGAGDGSTTFNLPDGRGRTFFGADAGAGRMASNNVGGNTGGAETHTGTIAELVTHSHTFVHSVWAQGTGSSVQGSSTAFALDNATNTTGSTTPYNNMPPYQAIDYWIIKAA